MCRYVYNYFAIYIIKMKVVFNTFKSRLVLNRYVVDLSMKLKSKFIMTLTKKLQAAPHRISHLTYDLVTIIEWRPENIVHTLLYLYGKWVPTVKENQGLETGYFLNCFVHWPVWGLDFVIVVFNWINSENVKQLNSDYCYSTS